MATANITGGVAGVKTFDHTATADMSRAKSPW
jgi:hypothetical protein